MNLSPVEIDQLADAIADRVAARLAAQGDPDALLDVHEKAAELNCSVPTIERLTASGQLRSVRVGRLRRYKRGDKPAQNRKGAHDE
ncbi:MAG: excisionase family DNA-binding protein [Pirellulaceae bacterium]